MNFEFSNHTALVTGASQGIGRAIAKGLSGQGVKVAMAARRTAILEEVAAEIRKAAGTEPVIIEADLYPDGASEALAQKALDALGHVDMLMNSAGGSRPLTDAWTKEQWMEALTLNFLRIRELTHVLIPSMRERGFGRIVGSGLRGPQGQTTISSFCHVERPKNVV